MHRTRHNHTEIDTINRSSQNNIHSIHVMPHKLNLMARHRRWSQMAILSVTEACNHLLCKWQEKHLIDKNITWQRLTWQSLWMSFTYFQLLEVCSLNDCCENHNALSQVLPKVIWEKCVATSHGREWTSPLHVLAAQYSLQTNPITQPRVCYIHTTMPHASYTLHYASCPILLPPQKKKFPLP